jgi:hypothetical protein
MYPRKCSFVYLADALFLVDVFTLIGSNQLSIVIYLKVTKRASYRHDVRTVTCSRLLCLTFHLNAIGIIWFTYTPQADCFVCKLLSFSSPASIKIGFSVPPQFFRPWILFRSFVSLTTEDTLCLRDNLHRTLMPHIFNTASAILRPPGLMCVLLYIF